MRSPLPPPAESVPDSIQILKAVSDPNPMGAARFGPEARLQAAVRPPFGVDTPTQFCCCLAGTFVERIEGGTAQDTAGVRDSSDGLVRISVSFGSQAVHGSLA